MPLHDPECPARMKAAAPVALPIAALATAAAAAALPAPVAVVCFPFSLYLAFGGVVAFRHGVWRTRPDLTRHLANGLLMACLVMFVVALMLLSVMPIEMIAFMMIPVALSAGIGWSVLATAEGKRRQNAPHVAPATRPARNGGDGSSSPDHVEATAHLDEPRLRRAGAED